MKGTVTQENLASLLSIVGASIPARATLPVLTNVLLRLRDGRLQASGTNLDFSVITEVPADVEEPGELTVPYKKLFDLARNFPAGAISLSVTNNRLVIHSGAGKFRLSGIVSSEFPMLPALDFSDGFEIPASVPLGDTITRTTFAVSTEPSRPILNGVLCGFQDNTMYLVATDGHRLAENLIPLEGETPDIEQMIIPPLALNHLLKLLGEDKPVRVARDSNTVGFSIGDTILLCRLIEGPYPNYKIVIPQDYEKKAVLDRASLERVLRQIIIVADGSNHRVTINLLPSELVLQVPESEGVEGGDGEIRVPASYSGPPMKIAFNGSYLLELLGKIPTEQVEIQFGAPERATIILPVDMPADGPRYLSVLMPLRMMD